MLEAYLARKKLLGWNPAMLGNVPRKTRRLAVDQPKSTQWLGVKATADYLVKKAGSGWIGSTSIHPKKRRAKAGGADAVTG
jgi:hypothetical protein